MMSASQMSKFIREKKKKALDATDLQVDKQHEIAEPNDENEPEAHEEHPSVSELNAKAAMNEPHEESAPNPDLEIKKKKQMKIKSMFAKIGK